MRDTRIQTPPPNDGFRKFSTGANRDTANGKLEYANYINPLNDYSFSKYMCSKQIIGGEYRRGDNRQKGIPYESLFDSLCRHMEILKLLYKGYTVMEENKEGVIKLHVLYSEDAKLITSESCGMDVKTIEGELNAIRFNSEAMKLQTITGNIITE